MPPRGRVAGNNYLVAHAMHMILKTFLFFITRIPFSCSTVFEKYPIYLLCLFPSMFRPPFFCFLFVVFVHTHKGFRLLLVLSLVGIYTFHYVKCGMVCSWSREGWQIFSVMLSQPLYGSVD